MDMRTNQTPCPTGSSALSNPASTEVPEYARTRFDWESFLNKEEYRLVELIEANMRSGDWMTCACGSYSHHLRRTRGGRPGDRMLGYLGNEFHMAIGRIMDAWEPGTVNPAMKVARKRAVELYKAIEKRSTHLLSREYYGPIL
jgi:hypothetical protein